MATDLTYAYAADITKAERDANGDLYVYGKATGPDRDLDGQRCDPDWLKTAMPEWYQWGNVREMHQPIAAGVGVALVDEGDDWFVKSLVVDDGTAKKIEKQLLKGYSIGIKDPHIQVREGQEWIVGGNICEISYVDRPCNPTAKLAICKAAGADGALQPVEAESDEMTIKVAGSVFSPGDLAKLLATKKTLEADAAKSTEEPAAADDSEATPNGEDPEDNTETAASDTSAAIPEQDQGEPAELKGVDADSSDATLIAELMKQYGLTPDQAEKIPAWLRPVVLNATADTAKREFSTAERSDAADAGQALPDGSFPIKSVQDLKNAVRAIGRAKDPAKAKAHIKRRAKALGRQDLIPDEWKTTDPDLAKAEGEQIHDPGEIAAVRDGLVELIKAELDELCDGDQELNDVSELLCSLRMLMCWWDGEAAAGETDSPYSKPTTAGMEVMLSTDPDLTKSENTQTPESDGDSTDDRLAELVKSLVAKEKTALTEAAEERNKALAAELEQVKADLAKALALPEPGGPVITRTPAMAAAAKQADADLLKQQADDLKARAEQVEGHDPNLARGYRLRAQELLTKAVA